MTIRASSVVGFKWAGSLITAQREEPGGEEGGSAVGGDRDIGRLVNVLFVFLSLSLSFSLCIFMNIC